MDNITEIHTGFLVESPYLKTCRLKYTQNGKKRFWDFLETHDSVAVMLYNVTRNVMIFVRQFRPAVYFCSLETKDQMHPSIDVAKYRPALGVTLEPPSGMVEPETPKCITAREEVFAETGYNISLHDLEIVSTYRKEVSVQGSQRTLYFCEVTDDARTGKGGGIDDKITDVVELTIPDMEKMTTSIGPHNCSPTCLLGILWFLRCRASKYQQSSSSNEPDIVAGKSS